MMRAGVCIGLLVILHGWAGRAEETPEVAALRAEVRDKGWIVFGARTERGDYDLFRCRPDGSAQTNLTHTPQFNEAYPLCSRDGARLLYRRLPRNASPDGNRCGEQGVPVMARANGTDPRALGADGDLPWASWSPDGQQLLCLAPKGFAIMDAASGKPLQRFPRGGFFQQPTWSPDGRWIVGVANAFDTSWSIARLSSTGGTATAVNRVDCCTPDWFPDSRNVIFSWRPPGQKAANGNGWTQLWRAEAEGRSPQLVYGEDGRHVYGGHVSPDGAYVIFTGNAEENGDPGHQGAPMNLMRLRDAPIIGGTSEELRGKFPHAHSGPLLSLPVGWEPCWTFGGEPAASAAGLP